MDKKEQEEFGKCYDHVSQRLIDAEALLSRSMNAIRMVYIDQDMFTGWLDKTLAKIFNDRLDEYSVYTDKYLKR